MEKPGRESKKTFLERIDRERRRAAVEEARIKLKASGKAERDIQAALVERFQPVDGTKTVSWQTPDSWNLGRKFWKTPAPDSQVQFDLDLQWVHDHQGQEVQPPTPGAKLLMAMAEKRPEQFLSLYLKRLPHIVQIQVNENKVREKALRNRRARRAAAKYQEQLRFRDQENDPANRAGEQDVVPKCQDEIEAASVGEEVIKPPEPIEPAGTDDWEEL